MSRTLETAAGVKPMSYRWMAFVGESNLPGFEALL